jgi:hypothetical protein
MEGKSFLARMLLFTLRLDRHGFLWQLYSDLCRRLSMEKPVLDQVIAELIIGGEFSLALGALAWGWCLDRIQLRW